MATKFYSLLSRLNYLHLFHLPFANHALLFSRVIRYSNEGCGLTFAVHVVPRASSSRIVGEHDGALRVRIAAAPVEGAANKELVRVLAKLFQLPQNAVEIISGANSKTKKVRIQGADAAQLEQLIMSK
jgi:uncharacterized protein (TIGR00251 family)